MLSTVVIRGDTTAVNNNLEDFLSSVGNAIKQKKGITTTLPRQNWVQEIASINTGGSSATENYLIFAKMPTIKMYWDSIPNDGILPARAFQIGADFGYNNSISEAHLPDIIIINGFCFQNNESLTTLYLPNCTIIQGGSSFTGCKKLSKLELPAVTSISNSSFSNCTRLKTVIIGTAESTAVCTLGGTGVFTGTPIVTSDTEGFIYVADGLVDQYKEATNWITYASKIKGISQLPSEV